MSLSSMDLCCVNIIFKFFSQISKFCYNVTVSSIENRHISYTVYHYPTAMYVFLFKSWIACSSHAIHLHLWWPQVKLWPQYGEPQYHSNISFLISAPNVCPVFFSHSIPSLPALCQKHDYSSTVDACYSLSEFVLFMSPPADNYTVTEKAVFFFGRPQYVASLLFEISHTGSFVQIDGDSENKLEEKRAERHR